MRRNKKVRIYLKDKKNPFVFKITFEKFIELLNFMEECEDTELINIENIYFLKKEFIYAIYK